MQTDFVICDNADHPHIKITRDDETIATVQILNGNVSEAEDFAMAILQTLDLHSVHYP